MKKILILFIASLFISFNVFAEDSNDYDERLDNLKTE